MAATLCAANAGGRKLAFCETGVEPLWLPVLFVLPALFASEEPEPPPHAASTAMVSAVNAETRTDGNTKHKLFKIKPR